MEMVLSFNWKGFAVWVMLFAVIASMMGGATPVGMFSVMHHAYAGNKDETSSTSIITTILDVMQTVGLLTSEEDKKYKLSTGAWIIMIILGMLAGYFYAFRGMQGQNLLQTLFAFAGITIVVALVLGVLLAMALNLAAGSKVTVSSGLGSGKDSISTYLKLLGVALGIFWGFQLVDVKNSGLDIQKILIIGGTGVAGWMLGFAVGWAVDKFFSSASSKGGLEGNWLKSK